jgi:hypothetical protein
MSESTLTTAEVWYLRLRSHTRTLVRLLAIVCVLVGAYNLLLVPVFETSTVAAAVYRPLVPVRGDVEYVADIVLMTVGAVVAWWV